MKKRVSIVLVICIILSTFAGVYAQSFDESISKDKKKFSYNYESIKVNSDSPLTNEQLSFIYDNINKNTEAKDGEVIKTVISIPPEEQESIMIAGPVKTTYNNSGINKLLEWSVNNLVFAVDATVWQKISAKAAIVAHALQTFFLLDVEEWVESQPDEVYTEKWIWKSYSSYYDCYILYGTIVRYSDSSYSTPREVETYQIGMEN